MFDIKSAIFIRRDPQTVFAYLTHPDALPDWAESVQRAEAEPPGELRAGSRLREELVLFGSPRVVEWSVVEWEMPSRIVFEAATFMVTWTRVDFRLSADQDGTELEVHVQGRGRGIWRLLEPLLANRFRTYRRLELARIKAQLEQPGAEVPGEGPGQPSSF